MKKTFIFVVLLLAVVGYGASFFPLDFLKPNIERALEHGLERRVEISGVHLTFLNGPGLALDGVTIHEDPRAGIEPFAYAETVQARLDLLGLLRGHLRFSSLRFDDATLNLVKPDNQPWNFQMLLVSGMPGNSVAPIANPGKNTAGERDVPVIKMRAARVNLKFGQTKSVVYFDDVDLDVSPQPAQAIELRFSGMPARTDRATRDLGHFFIRGTYQPSMANHELNLTAELEASPMDAVARLFGNSSFQPQGSLAFDAQISGSPADLDVKGSARLDSVSKWSYQGKLSIPQQNLRLQSLVETHRAETRIPESVAKPENIAKKDVSEKSTSDQGRAESDLAPAPIRVEVWDLLSVPHWDVVLDQAPVETFIALAKQLGAPVPDKLSAKGIVAGAIALRDASGIAGQFDITDASWKMPGAELVQTGRLIVSIKEGIASFGPVGINAGKTGTAELTGQYTFATSEGNPAGEVNMKLTSPGLNLAGFGPGADALGTTVFAHVPILQFVSEFPVMPSDPSQDHTPGRMRGQLSSGNSAGEAESTSRQSAGIQRAGTGLQGTGLQWKGWAQYHYGQDGKTTWTGEYELQNASIRMDGVSDPLLIRSAAVSMKGERVDVTRIRARAGEASFTGEYHWDPSAAKPHSFRIQLGDVTAQQLDRLFAPALSRDRGFLSRTLRLGSPQPPPDWMLQRQAEGIVSVHSIVASGHRLRLDLANVIWDGAEITVAGSRASLDDAPLSGELRVDLSGRAPVYHFAGKIEDAPFKAGRLDLNGELDAEGVGADLLTSLRTRGTFRGRGIAFSPDVEFKKAAGRFEIHLEGGQPRLKLLDLELTQGNDIYSGEGVSQADGRLILDLASGGRQVRYTGSFSTVVFNGVSPRIFNGQPHPVPSASIKFGFPQARVVESHGLADLSKAD